MGLTPPQASPAAGRTRPRCRREPAGGRGDVEVVVLDRMQRDAHQQAEQEEESVIGPTREAERSMESIVRLPQPGHEEHC